MHIPPDAHLSTRVHTTAPLASCDIHPGPGIRTEKSFHVPGLRPRAWGNVSPCPPHRNCPSARRPRLLPQNCWQRSVSPLMTTQVLYNSKGNHCQVSTQRPLTSDFPNGSAAHRRTYGPDARSVAASPYGSDPVPTVSPQLRSPLPLQACLRSWRLGESNRVPSRGPRIK